MKTSDDIVELSKFKYSLFELDCYTLTDEYFNDEKKHRSINLFKELLSSKDGKYYRHSSIINKMLLIIGGKDFLKSFSKEEQRDIIFLIKNILKNNILEIVSEEEFFKYEERIINEYFMIENVINNERIPIDYNLLKLFSEILYDYPSIILNNDLLLNNIRKYISEQKCMTDNYFSRVKCYICSSYTMLRKNRSGRNLVIR